MHNLKCVTSKQASSFPFQDIAKNILTNEEGPRGRLEKIA